MLTLWGPGVGGDASGATGLAAELIALELGRYLTAGDPAVAPALGTAVLGSKVCVKAIGEIHDAVRVRPEAE